MKEQLNYVAGSVDGASTALLLALAEARRVLGDNSDVTKALMVARTALTNAAEAVEFELNKENRNRK